MFTATPGRLPPGPYRSLFADRTFRRSMPVFALSDLGDGMTVVAVVWLAFALGPDGGQGALAGIAVASYVLPGALGALVLGRWMRRLPARRLLVTDSALRAVLLGAVPLAHMAGLLTPAVYVGLLGASSLLHAWGKADRLRFRRTRLRPLLRALFHPDPGPRTRRPLTTVLAARSAVLLTASPLGAALGGLLLDRTSALAVLVGCGVLMILTVPISIVVLKLHGARRRRCAGGRGSRFMRRAAY
ncbi:hypothetical protein [Streptomyces sp. NPDC056169]|uniref:hypothetical protein n=1 Tax=Streptomyces sp. NPDC056169 TaxID=3345734 RepID=UPI0035D9B77E